jgi:hypothetical protein
MIVRKCRQERTQSCSSRHPKLSSFVVMDFSRHRVLGNHYNVGIVSRLYRRTRWTVVAFAIFLAHSGAVGQNQTAPSKPPIPLAESAARLEIEISDSPLKNADGTFTFRVVADDHFPENHKSTGHPHVEFSPYISTTESAHSSVSGRTVWTYSAKADGNQNLVRLRVSICETGACTGRLDKTRQRIVDLGSSSFDDYTVVVHPRQLVAGKTEKNAYISLERLGKVLTPTTILKLHASARDGCVRFESKSDRPGAPDESIDLVIDGDRRQSQTEYFIMLPANLPPENCVIDVAVFDDERQRPTPTPDQLVMKTNTLTSVVMSFLGCIAAFVFPLWGRIKKSQKPLLKWADLFEIIAKGFLAVLLGLVLTNTQFIGITIDKTSANGFFTTGFFLGFLPLETVFDRILRFFGINPPADDLAQDAQPVSSS